jgi:hypothetical protein
MDHKAVLFELGRRDPLDWRKRLIVNGKPWGPQLSPVQLQDFKALDPAWLYVTGNSKAEMPEIRRAFLQRSRGYSKSTDIASTLLWSLVYSTKLLPGVVAAATQEQASLILDAAKELISENPWIADNFVTVQKAKLIAKNSGTHIDFIATNAKGAFGMRPKIAVFDEFTHCEDEKFFGAFYSSYGKETDKGAVCVIACNAGYGRDWHWAIKEEAMTSAAWYHHAPAGSSPWYTPEMLEDQKAILISMPEEYRRLWLNEWQESNGTFVTMSEAEACINPDLKYRDAPEPEIEIYVATLDYAEKVDRTVGMVCHMEDGIVIIDRMDVLDPALMPKEDEWEDTPSTVPVAWCAQWMDDIQNKFGTGNHIVHFVIDDDELKYIRDERLTWGYSIHTFKFAGGAGNYQLSKALRMYLLQKKIQWYPECGQIQDMRTGIPQPIDKRDDLCTELAALYRKKIGDKWRMDHQRGGHDDRAFCLGAAVWLFDNATAPEV